MRRIKPPKELHIAARGDSTRMREYMDSLGYGPDDPKHLLPTGNGMETILGRIIRAGLAAPMDHEGPVIVHANRRTAPTILHHPDIPIEEGVVVRAAKMSMDAMDVYTERVMHDTDRRRVIGSAGDFYAHFDWKRMLAHHESHKFPVTFLVGSTPTGEPAAVYDVATNGGITKMARAVETHATDVISVGAYIFDPSDRVIQALTEIASRNLSPADDPLGQTLIRYGLVGAYFADGPVFNINTRRTYEEMLSHNAAHANGELGISA